jgi:5'-3' exonuclease
LFRNKFAKDYGEMIICCDGKDNWRKKVFPEYKANRRKNRENDPTDWKTLFELLHEMREDLTKYFPYKVMHVDSAEADDIIGVLSAETSDEVMILSGDKDFIQLQKYPNVKQYSPITKKMVGGMNPVTYLQEHIFKGDTSDGVPNVLSPDNTFTEGLRQRPLSAKKISSWVDNNINDVLPNDEVKRNYQRNKKLIDLTCCPEELTSEIIHKYKEAIVNDRSKLLNYFIKTRLKTLTESIGEF